MPRDASAIVLAGLCATTASATLVFDDLENIGADGTDVTQRQIGDVLVSMGTASGMALSARTYGSTDLPAFWGMSDALNTPSASERLSGSRFLSTSIVNPAEPGSLFTANNPIWFEFDQDVVEFGLTTLDLLEQGSGSTDWLALRAYDIFGNLLDEQIRTGAQGAAGVDLRWSVASEGASIARVELVGDIVATYGGFGIDDLAVAASVIPAPASLVVLAVAGLGGTRRRRA